MRLRFIRDERGAASAEYALLLSVFGGAIALAGLQLGNSIGGAFGDVAATIAAAGHPPATDDPSGRNGKGHGYGNGSGDGHGYGR